MMGNKNGKKQFKIERAEKGILPFNRCQINKTVEYGQNGSYRTTVMFNVRENHPGRAARLFKVLTDEYYKNNPSRQKPSQVAEDSTAKNK